MSLAVALGAGMAVAAEGNGSDDDVPELDDVVTVQELQPSTTFAPGITAVTTLGDDSLSSPFDDEEGDDPTAESPDPSPDESFESPDPSPDESLESVETADDSPESPDDSPESPDSEETPDS